MDVISMLKNLHPLEIKVLTNLKKHTQLSASLLIDHLKFKEGHANQAFSWLNMKNLIKETKRIKHVFYELTEVGASYAKNGMPESRLISFLEKQKKIKLPDITTALSITFKEAGAAFSFLSKEGAVKMDEEKNVVFIRELQSKKLSIIDSLFNKVLKNEEHVLKDEELTNEEKEVILSIAKKRGANDVPFKIVERDEIFYEFTPLANEVTKALEKAGITGEEAGQLTQEMLKTEEWKSKTFRAYNINLPPARMLLGRTNPYVDFLESVKDKLVGMGFEEFDGPLVETDFWNSDALFMPQFHAARDIHDVYYIKNPTHAASIEEPYLTRVSQIHKDGGNTGSRGWNYEFDKDFTRRLILRSQGTVLSAKQLRNAKVPGKYFGIARCFRSDKVDATHLSDFYQTEGIVLGENVNLKTLLGILKIFAVEIAGATEVKYVPGYFPFTEPSIEVHIKHPVIGWFELGGSGIMRPEVTKAMGIDVPVLAWGIGIDRMALMALKLNDLRELFSNDIENVRLRR
ncbi:MAG: phenylalanine--tRNA ligase subunit alpha [Treponema sp.]